MNTLVMATYNGSLFIHKQLDSILKQNTPFDSVIIVDDCSTDDTPVLIQEFIESHALNHWKLFIEKENNGHFKTFFKALRQVTHLSERDTIFLADQDDIWKPNKTQEMLKCFLTNPHVSMVSCRSDFIDENDCMLYSESNTHKITQQSFLKLCKKWPSGYQMAIRGDLLAKAISEKIDCLEGFRFHDVLLALFMGLYGQHLIVDSTLDKHRLHTNNVTRKIRKNSLAGKQGTIDYVRVCHTRLSSLLAYYQQSTKVDSEKTNALNKMIGFFKARELLLTSKNPKFLVQLLLNLKCYANKKNFLSDIFYTYISK